MANIVVIGNGMVGSRFAEELQDRDVRGEHDVIVLGEEEHEPYNRVLLTDFIAGRTSAGALVLPRPPDPGPGRRRAAVLRGRAATSVDRNGRIVLDAAGIGHRFDVLVFATGSRARIPALDGLASGKLPPGVHALRTLDDAREIVAATMNARSAVVVGGGVLGLEAATGLARRGLSVTLVHAADTLMERQLDASAGTVAVAALRAAGVSTELSATSRGVVLDPGGRVAGLELSDGRVLPAQLLVMSCGTIPEVGLAQRAGLDVQRGIVVGPDLSCARDPDVFAIGDCASPPEGGTGLIAQGWDQARRLAARLTSGARSQAPLGADATADVVRVKASGLDIVAMGASGARATGDAQHRVLRLSDPQQNRHVEVVVSADRVVGAVCIGAPAVAADLTVAYTRGTPIPADPAALLLRPVTAAPSTTASPTNMPDRMTVCRCNGVTKGDIKACWSKGARTAGDVAARTRATTGCGGCADVVAGLVDWLNTSDPDTGSFTHSQQTPADREVDVSPAKQKPHGLEISAT